MNKNDARKFVNRKLKLYRNAYVTDTVKILSLPVCTGVATNYTVSKFDTDLNPILMSILFCTSIGIVEILSIALFEEIHGKVVYNYSNEIKLLMQIKKELKKGKNRFEKVDNEDFDFEFDWMLKKQKNEIYKKIK